MRRKVEGTCYDRNGITIDLCTPTLYVESNTTTAELNLLDISKLDNVRFLWSKTVLINTSNTFPNMQMRSRTCSPSDRSAPAGRASSDWADPELVKFFKLHVIPYVETVYSI